MTTRGGGKIGEGTEGKGDAPNFVANLGPSVRNRPPSTDRPLMVEIYLQAQDSKMGFLCKGFLFRRDVL